MTSIIGQSCSVTFYPAARHLARAFVVAILVVLVLIAPPVAHANRFGPPWLGIVIADGVHLYGKPALQSDAGDPLARDTVIPVLGQVNGEELPDGSTLWYRTPKGYVPGNAIREHREPWVAEIAVESATVYVYPKRDSPVRGAARKGDLVRVTGLSPGLDGDPHIWWATTEGFVRLEAIQGPSASPHAQSWTMPSADEAAHGWWGAIVSESNVRAAATTDAPIVGQLQAGQRVKVLGEEIGQRVLGSDLWYRIDGGRYAGARVHSSLIRRIEAPRPNTTRPGRVPDDQTWIVVDRNSRSLTLVKNGSPFFVTYVALGKAGVDTPTGHYATWGKFRYDDMTSASVEDATRSYDLPNVPFTQYYKEGGFAIHGTYWHDYYGTLQSQGCVNLTVTDGAYLFEQTRPVVPSGENEVWADGAATPVVILD